MVAEPASAGVWEKIQGPRASSCQSRWGNNNGSRRSEAHRAHQGWHSHLGWRCKHLPGVRGMGSFVGAISAVPKAVLVRSPPDQWAGRHRKAAGDWEEARLGVLQRWGQEVVGAPTFPLGASSDARGSRSPQPVLQTIPEEERWDHQRVHYS